MTVLARCCVGLVAGALFIATAAAQPAAVDFVHGGSWSVPVLSHHGARYAATMRQQYDFSCGSAALATLLTYHYGTPVGEDTVFAEMFEGADRERVRREGFSMLDMKRFLARRGFEADGFELPLDKLVEARIPAIVLIEDNGYRHFVVVKGVRDGRVLVGDSATGTRAVSRAAFDELWTSKLLFVIHNQQDLASFDLDSEWRHVPAAPVRNAVARDAIAPLTMPRLGVGEN